MVAASLNKLLSDYKVDRDFREMVKDGYRLPLQEVINGAFSFKPNYRYGGSLAKGTANSNSCDVDLLCYLDSDCGISVEDIYKKVSSALAQSSYIYACKNSAICVTGEAGEEMWDISVDVVPGKYTSNDANKDVYLWCNKDKQRLKSNPEIQIGKVQESSMKDVIRLIKLFRSFHNFKFKSFFLEIFAIDVVEPTVTETDNVYDKLVKFCSYYNEIGVTKIYDPANAHNDIMGIHSEAEFDLIRKKIKQLYEVLLTNDADTIVTFLKGQRVVDIEKAYAKDAKSHSASLRLDIQSYMLVECKTAEGKPIYSGVEIEKGVELKFYITVPPHIDVERVSLVVSNAGYESIKCPRGKEETTRYIGNRRYIREEHTSYNGNHYVQAVLRTKHNRIFYSSPFVVKIRDFK